MKLLRTVIFYALLWPVIQLVAGCRYLYREVWLKFLFWFNKTAVMGGRAKAGKRGRQSRLLRLLGNGLSFLGFGLGVAAVGASIWFTGGLSLPLWAFGLIFLGVSINLLALPVGSSANTVKIQTYYDTEWELQLLNNEKACIDQEPPHGMQSPLRQQVMLGVRYGHDVNGLMGTMASWAGTIVDVVSALIMPVAAVVSSVIFLISRASGLISAGGAPFTNQHRLWVHKKNIREQIHLYYDLALLNSKAQHLRVGRIINEAFENIMLEKSEHHYNSWVKFRCYHAVERVLVQRPDLTDMDITAKVQDFVEEFCKPKRTWLQKISADKTLLFALDGEKIKQILHHSENNLISQNDNKKIDVCVLDAMPYFEERLYHKLCEHIPRVKPAVERFVKTYFKADEQGYTALFTDYLTSLLLEQGEKVHTETLSQELYLTLVNRLNSVPYITYQEPYWSLEPQKLIDNWPIETSHGKQFVATYQLKQVAILFKDCYLQQRALESSKSSPQEEKMPASEALEIWLSIIKDKDDISPEGKYDDHDPTFHGVKVFCLKYMTEELTKAKEKSLGSDCYEAVKLALKEKLKMEIVRSTQVSCFKLFTNQYIKPVPYKRFKVEPRPQTSQSLKLQTEWLNHGQHFVSNFSPLASKPQQGNKL